MRLNDGTTIPQLGLGVWKATDEQAAAAVREALHAGYRHVDTAAVYDNERGVGEGLRTSDVPRQDVFVTTKVWNDMQGADSTRRALEQSLERLGTDYVDLFLIHWPAPGRDLFVETWQTLIELRQQGAVRSIGVSNFRAVDLLRLVNETGVSPTLNQIELHPYLQQRELRTAHRDLALQTQAWSPLAQNKALTDPVIEAIARKHGRSPAQVVIRWHLDSGTIVIPKSVTASRIRDNIAVFDFTLDDDDHAQIAMLDSALRLGPDPAELN